MTESEWLSSTNPGVMLDFLRNKGHDRKLRLFAVACCLPHRHMLIPETAEALNIAERFADGLADQNERRAERGRVMCSKWKMDDTLRHRRGPAKTSVACALARKASDAAIGAARCAHHIGVLSKEDWDENAFQMTDKGKKLVDWSSGHKEQDAFQVGLLREIFGNPFQPANIDLSSFTPSIVQLARAIYDQHAFDRIGGLTDQLEQAGMNEIVVHFKSSPRHVRGCWALDILLSLH